MACTETPVAVETDLEPQFARGGVQLPTITSGGITTNDNSVPVPNEVDLLTIGAFIAQATDEGTVVEHDFFKDVFITVYTARGQIQVRGVLGDHPSGVQLGGAHAEVVCIANLGPSEGVDGDGHPDNEGNDVWEMRITFPVVVDETIQAGYGSFFFQDNGRGRGVDYADENFAGGLIFEPRCGFASQFGLEQVVQGAVTVRDIRD